MVKVSSVIFLLSLIVAFSGCSVSTTVVKTSDNKITITDRSVVSIIEPYVIYDITGLPIGAGYQETCNAFCVADVDAKYLVTAAHCLDGAGPGSRFQYISPTGFGSRWATVDWVGSAGDRAIALIDDDSLVPLTVDSSYEPQSGDRTITISSVFKDVSFGNLIGELGPYWYDSTQTVERGWSGSPVINDEGSVWGIISMCRLDIEHEICNNNYAIISSIY